jgi:toxin ParE1/3/4
VKVLFTPSAKRQFLSALKYIRKDNPDAARKLRAKSEKVLRRLEKHPLSGRTIPEFSDLPYRELIVPPYRFFYRIQDENIWVVAVWHDARLPQPPRS